MSFKKLHKTFILEGESFNNEKELLESAKRANPIVYEFLLGWFDTSEFIIVNTSGSTGKPKSIQLKKEFMVNSAKATGEFFELNSGTTALLCLPTDFIAGKMMLVRAMVLGWSLDIVEPNSSPLDYIKKKYDFSAMVPLQLFNSLDNLFKIKKLIVGGGIVSNELQSKIMDLPTKVYATYGMTETITHIAVKPLNFASGFSFKNDVYHTLPGVIIGKDYRDCLVVDASHLSGKQIITNDLVSVISSSKFKWLGRFDNIINSGGIKLIPEQIENKLSKIIQQRFFISSLPDAILGEKLVLIVESNNQENLKSQISNLKSIDKFEMPKEIYFVQQFVETKTKKVDRMKIIKAMQQK